MISLLIAGDFCPKDRVAQFLENGDYESVFDEVKEYTSFADYSIVNLEAPVVESTAKPIEKCGPNLKCTNKAVSALKWAGFDMVTLANNHFYDYGDSGVKDTLEACQNEGIAIVGGGMNIHEASKTAYVNIKGLKIAIINCCEHEFSIATESTGGSNPINPIQQYYAIQEAKRKADKILVIVHGGYEACQFPSPRMKDTYRFFIDAGAAAVINHHQHCYSGYEIYKEKPIIYGVGNFSFDRNTQRNSIWNKGYMTILTFDKENISLKIIPYLQGNIKAGIEILKDTVEFYQNINKINKIILNDKILVETLQEWVNNNSTTYKLALEPYERKIFQILFYKKFLPSMLSHKKCSRIINYLECESHLERLKFMLKNKIQK